MWGDLVEVVEAELEIMGIEDGDVIRAVLEVGVLSSHADRIVWRIEGPSGPVTETFVTGGPWFN